MRNLSRRRFHRERSYMKDWRLNNILRKIDVHSNRYDDNEKEKMRDYNIEGPQHEESIKIGILLNKKKNFE